MTTAPVIETVQVSHVPKGIDCADFRKGSYTDDKGVPSALKAVQRYRELFGCEPDVVFETGTGFAIPLPDGWRERENEDA